MRNKFVTGVRVAALAAFALSGLLAASAANAAATIVIFNADFDGEGFNDTTPVAPVGGNPGTTRGQQRLNAFKAAANKWGSTLTSPVPIVVYAFFDHLDCDAGSAVLGSAGAWSVYSDFPNAPKPDTWYPTALADKLAGVALDDTLPDIFAVFNNDLGTPGCLTGAPFYLGLDNNHGPLIDLVTVLTHEFGHGLGFQTFTDESDGTYYFGTRSVWDHFMRDTTQNLLWTEMTDAQRKASAINPRKLVWTGANVTAAAPSVLSFGVPQLRVNGPAAGAATGSYELGTASFGPLLANPGVTGEVMPISTATSTAGDGCAAFSAADKLAVTGNIALISRGVCGFTTKVKNAQNAGAIGVIIADNLPGGPPPGLGVGPADPLAPTITIPSARVTLADGIKLRASLNKRSRSKSGVIGTLGVNPAQLAGADPMGFVQLYTPNPVQPGSSVSHYDTGAFKNLLMEPAINGDLTHEVTPPNDLTYPLFKDIGW